MSRDGSFRRELDVALPLIKASASVVALIVTIKLQTDGGFFDGHDHGARASLFAFGGAVMLFYELIPNGHEPLFSRVAPWLTRIAGATLASFAAWNWVMSETNGDPISLMGGAVAGIGGLAMMVPAVLLFGMFFNLLESQHNRNRGRPKAAIERMPGYDRPCRTGGLAYDGEPEEASSPWGLRPPA